MRQLMGIEEKDSLPDPDETPAFDEEGRELCRPNWRVSITNGHNKKVRVQTTRISLRLFAFPITDLAVGRSFPRRCRSSTKSPPNSSPKPGFPSENPSVVFPGLRFQWRIWIRVWC